MTLIDLDQPSPPARRRPLPILAGVLLVGVSVLGLPVARHSTQEIVYARARLAAARLCPSLAATPWPPSSWRLKVTCAPGELPTLDSVTWKLRQAGGRSVTSKAGPSEDGVRRDYLVEGVLDGVRTSIGRGSVSGRAPGTLAQVSVDLHRAGLPSW